MKKINQHLLEVQESYWEHWKFGIWAAAILLCLSILSAIHALFPFLLPGIPERIYRYFNKRTQIRLRRIERIRNIKK